MNLADLFSALADPTRIRVLEMLRERARPVHELAASFDISRPAISRHLRVLKEAGLVRELKKGRENVYSLQAKHLRPAAEWLQQHGSAETKAGRVPAKPIAPDPATTAVPKKPKAPATARELPNVAPAPIPAPPQLSFFDL